MFSRSSSKPRSTTTTTAKRFWQQSINNGKPTYSTAIKKDSGVSLLVLANCTAGCLILTFAGRKIFYHPDVLIGPSIRRPELGFHNETIARDDCSEQYRQQTQFFAEHLSNAASPIVRTLIGTDSATPCWKLDFTRRSHETIDIPLEHTAHFNDGYFADVTPGSIKTAQTHRRDAL